MPVTVHPGINDYAALIAEEHGSEAFTHLPDRSEYDPLERDQYRSEAARVIGAVLGNVEVRLRAMAERLEAKGGQHLGTADGVRLATIKVIEIADSLTRQTEESR